MYDVPNKRQSDYARKRQLTSSFHGVRSGIILEITPVVTGHRKQQRVTEYQQNCFLFLAFIDAR